MFLLQGTCAVKRNIKCKMFALFLENYIIMLSFALTFPVLTKIGPNKRTETRSKGVVRWLSLVFPRTKLMMVS